MMLYKLKLAACFGIPEGFGTCIISLVDEAEKRALSILTQEYVAEQLKACNSKTSDFKNDVISVLWTLFDRQNVDDFYLEFDATPERGIYATLVNKITNERMSIKTDQAVLLSVAADIEMYTTEMVIKELSTPFNKNDMSTTSCAVSLLSLPDQMLEKALDCAINEEDYEAASAIRDEIERRHYERQMDEVHRLEGIIEQQRRWRHFITADSKQKMLDKKLAELDAPDRSAKTLGFSFGEVEPTGNEVLNVRGLSKSFGSKDLFSGVEFQLRRFDRAFLLGPNGCGKTTLLKILIGKERADSGSYLFGAGVQLGYFDQTLSSLDGCNTVLDEIWNLHRDFTEARVRTLLGQFLFCADDVFKKVETLSGGEKARLSLLKLMLSGANVLLLDEPTNHLDIPSREALEAALLDFGGTMLVVSHDRYFINKLSTRVLSIGMGGAESFDGGYDDYAARIAEQSAEKPKTAKTVGKGGEDYKRRKERESELRRTATAIKRCEERINELDELIANTNAEMSTPETAADYARVMELTETLGKLNGEQTELMLQWEELENRKAQLEGEE